MVTAAPLQKFLGPMLVILLALLLRLVLLPHETHDYTNYFYPWYEYIRLNGGFWALADDFSNYTPPYGYGMVLVSQLFPTLAPVAAIKLITFPFEALAAIGLYSLWRRLTVDPYFAKVMTLAFLFSPTLVLEWILLGSERHHLHNWITWLV